MPIPKLFLVFVAAAFLFLSNGCGEDEYATSPQTSTKESAGASTEKRDATDKGIKQAEKEHPTIQTAFFLKDPIKASIVEIAPEAVPIWREFREQKPILVLLSQHPYLYAPPAELSNEVSQLLLNGSVEDFYEKARLSHANPAITLQQTVRACIQNGFFKEVLWVTAPTQKRATTVDYNAILKLLVETGTISQEETNLFEVEETSLKGSIDSIPFTVTSLDHFPALTTPAILHFDLSYFTNNYRNAVKTPIHGIIQYVLHSLQKASVETLATTISLSTGPLLVPLKMRFIGTDLVDVISNPKKLDLELSPQWEKKQNILYLEYFFQPSETKKLVSQLLETTPEDPWAHYWDYLMTAKDGKIDEALKKLDYAISLDSGYADEYLELADRAKKKGWTLQRSQFLQKALAIHPKNASVEIQLLETELALEQFDQALKRIAHLEEEPWSPLYHPTVQNYLVQAKQLAQERLSTAPK